MSRKQAREVSFKLIFEYSLIKRMSNRLVDDLSKEAKLSHADIEYAKNLINKVKDNYQEIIDVINNNLINYTIERIYKIDLAIIILATCELIYNKDISYKIVINEAIELSKKYSTEKSFSFINGILGKINNNIG